MLASFLQPLRETLKGPLKDSSDTSVFLFCPLLFPLLQIDTRCVHVGDHTNRQCAVLLGWFIWDCIMTPCC